MVYNLDMIREFYANYSTRVNQARKTLGHPLTYAEKVLWAHVSGAMQ